MGQHYAYVQGPPPAPDDRLSPVGDMQLGVDVAPHTYGTETSKTAIMAVATPDQRLSVSLSHPAVIRLTASAPLFVPGFQCLDRHIERSMGSSRSAANRHYSETSSPAASIFPPLAFGRRAHQAQGDRDSTMWLGGGNHRNRPHDDVFGDSGLPNDSPNCRRRSPTKPCNNTSGGPRPSRWNAIRSPPTSTASTTSAPSMHIAFHDKCR